MGTTPPIINVPITRSRAMQIHDQVNANLSISFDLENMVVPSPPLLLVELRCNIKEGQTHFSPCKTMFYGEETKLGKSSLRNELSAEETLFRFWWNNVLHEFGYPNLRKVSITRVCCWRKHCSTPVNNVWSGTANHLQREFSRSYLIKSLSHLVKTKLVLFHTYPGGLSRL